ncbi:hypothetical protein HO133_009127 [Letharia lupina]|uniref:Uncharacterized protein n=1 Tax=Letharia lupina TaxID=560253 RepID=A0A8H6CNC0_9LECA|nr:uncharacterized protein HO133_009127 [Letharia lupina]KAF6226261.1 hypothetical protein HO133_009127 [Letharia lupina]
MYVATAASAYGLDSYQALLAEPEDDILKPKCTLATQKSIAIARKHWRKFCQEIFPKSLDAEVDPIERLHHVCFRDLQTTTDEAQKKQLRELQRSRQTLRKRLLKEAAIEKRIRFFHCIDSDDIRQAKHGVPQGNVAA